jgi:hypothetical protein
LKFKTYGFVDSFLKPNYYSMVPEIVEILFKRSVVGLVLSTFSVPTVVYYFKNLEESGASFKSRIICLVYGLIVV